MQQVWFLFLMLSKVLHPEEKPSLVFPLVLYRDVVNHCPQGIIISVDQDLKDRTSDYSLNCIKDTITICMKCLDLQR